MSEFLSNELFLSRSYHMNSTLTPKSHLILSSSGSQSSIDKHNTMLRKLGVDVAYFSFAHEISAEQYANSLRAPFILGGAVTSQGLKTDILPFLDLVTPEIDSLQAVNTVVNINGKLSGFNTDALGLEIALREYFEKHPQLQIKSAVIYGNGGVSGVAYQTLKRLGFKTTLRGRNESKVAEKRAQLQCTDFSGPYDLVVNATPVSYTALDHCPDMVELLTGAKAVFDHCMPEKDGKINHLERYCQQEKIPFIRGRDMYIPQMIRQWELFLDRRVRPGAVREYVTEHYAAEDRE